MRWLMLLVATALATTPAVRAQSYRADGNAYPYPPRPSGAVVPASLVTPPAPPRGQLPAVEGPRTPAPQLPAVEGPRTTSPQLPAVEGARTPTSPATPSTTTPQAQDPSLAATSPPGGGSAPASAAPNLFGDPFALRAIDLRFTP